MVEIVEDILKPIVRHIRSAPEIQELNSLVPDGGVNPVLGPPTLVWDGSDMVPNPIEDVLWVFRREDESGVPPREVEGTSTSAITVSSVRSWAGTGARNTLQYPELTVHYRADPTRGDVVGAPKMLDGAMKIRTIHKYVTKVLTRIDNPGSWFSLWGGTLRVVSCSPGDSLTFLPVLEGDGMMEARATFELEVHL